MDAITLKQITRGGIIDDVTTGTVYNFDWIVGTDTASGSRVNLDASFNSTVSFNPNGSQVSGLPGDQTYSVIVTKQEGPATEKEWGCKGVFTFFISDDPDDITTDLALDIVTTDVLNCSPLNSGAIEVTSYFCKWCK